MVHRRAVPGLLWALVLGSAGLWGCQEKGGDGEVRGSPGEEEGSAEETWSVSGLPLLEIGVREGEEPYQLDRARGSVRLDDGRIVVADGGSQELRFFDKSGRYLKAVGGDGEGPGEFRFPARVRKVGGDSLLVWDQRLQRVSFFDLQGEFLGAETIRPTPEVMFPGDEWLLGRFWVDSPVVPMAREAIRRAAERIPLPDSLRTLLYLKVTRQGRIWASEIRPPADTALTWTVYELDGTPRARVSTPPRFEPHDIGEDYVLGRYLDEMDVNFIRLHSLEKPDRSPAGPGLDSSPPAEYASPLLARSAAEEEILQPIRAFVKNLASLQEIHYADNYSYTTDTEELFSHSRTGVPDGLEVTILFAGAEGWMGTVTDEESGRYCALAYGSFVPMGWSPGEVVCP